VISSGGIKCVVLKMREKEEREEKVKEKGKDAVRYCLCYDPNGDNIPYRKTKGWKGKEIMREMMWMIEEEGMKEIVIMSCSHQISNDDVPSFNHGLGMCLHEK
jgi:hypothetical protein